ncbi:MAG TPA: XrtA/PEP-CTERM system TPR-repeat protein PrsT [Burkholderiaceae bacterium]|nr:XrtA/PEP-CTERM system TPR-repeat protein PrsT [Burkholderiaceae bacterium]
MTLPRIFQCGQHHARGAVLAALLCVLSAPTFAVQDAKAARYYEDALARYEKRDLAGAIIQLKNALQIDRTMLPVQMLLGKALLQNGEVGAAEVAFTEALRLGVNRAEVVIPLAQSVVAQGKHKLLLEQPQFAPGGLPAGVRAQLLLLRAAASSDLGETRAALKAIEEARAVDSTSVDAWLAEIPVRVRIRQFREAGEAADKALALAPGHPEAIYQKGSVLHVQGDLKAALAAYDRALQANPAHFEARIARAGLSIDFGKLKEADSDVTELLRLAPGEPRAMYLKAQLAGRNNDEAGTRAALREVTNLIDSVPLDFIRYRPQLLMLNGIAHFELNEREKAKPYLEILQRSHGNSAASKLLAQIYLGESNIARAIEVLETLIKAQPGDSQAMALLASAHMAQGRHARATSLMQEALKANDAPELRTTLGLSMIGSGQTGNAIAELETAYKRDPDQTRAGAALVALYLRSGQAAKAAGVAQSLVKLRPGNPSFFNLLGTAQGQAGKIAEAKAAFEQASKLDDSLLAPKLNLAKLEIASKSYAAATARLEGVLKADEKNTEAMFDMAVIAGRQGQMAEAQRWLEKATDVAGPRDLKPGLALVDLHLRGGRPSPALEAAKRLSAKAPDDVGVLIAYSKAQLANADAVGAKTSLNSATRFADFNAPAQVEIATLQMAANNLPGAAYSLEKALSGRPDFLPANALLAEVELRQGDFAKAEKRAKEVVDKIPKRAIGYSLQGDVARARGQATAALELYRRAHQLEPSTESLMRLFRAMGGPTGNQAGLQLGSEWIKTRPNDTLVRKALAEGYVRAGNLASARRAYEDLLKVSPDDAMALNNLANVLLRLKDNEAAIKRAEQANVAAPGNAKVIDTLGWALYRHGQTDRALQLLRDARLREPANLEIRYHLAAVLAHTGRKTEAREELVAVLKSSMSSEWSADAKALAAELK